MSPAKKPMMTPRKLAANRANARFSVGPTTVEGKERIRAANIRHRFHLRALLARAPFAVRLLDALVVLAAYFRQNSVGQWDVWARSHPTAVKKLISQPKWKGHLASRSRSQQKAIHRFRLHESERHVRAASEPHRKSFKKTSFIEAPQKFSLIENPNGTIRFLNTIKLEARTRNVSVDLSKVDFITPDAIAGLLATIHHSRVRPAVIYGNCPLDDRARDMLNDSGFRDYVYNPQGRPYRPPMGTVRRRVKAQDVLHSRFDQFLADDLVEFGTGKLYGNPRPNGPSFSVLCEAMLNTFTHASRNSESHEPWWASVYYDDERQRVCFTFVDQGVGIFQSYGVISRLRAWAELNIFSRAQILERLFQGKIPSSTNLPGRGNGIPGMYEHCKTHRIHSLVVLTNNVLGEAEKDRYEVLGESFRGTLLYWEIMK
jgi:hypothetical protein